MNPVVGLSLALCDDNPELLAREKELLQKDPDNMPGKIYTFSDPEALLRAAEQTPFDLAVLDIEMPRQNGISLAQKLLAQYPECQIIFLTAYIAYCQDVYDVAHIAFVLKEEMQTRLPVAVKRACARRIAGAHTPWPTDRLLAMGDPGNAYQLPQGDILYLEHQGRITWVHTIGGRLACAEKLENLLARLDPTAFCQTHKSFAVHWTFAGRYDKKSICLTDGTQIPISRNYQAAVRRSFLAYVATLQPQEEVLL